MRGSKCGDCREDPLLPSVGQTWRTWVHKSSTYVDTVTAAGKAFLDHARLALMQVDATVEAARKAARPARKTFNIGFQTGHEMNWLPRTMQVLHDQLTNIQVVVSSDYSPDLAEALARN
jgi:DNA-binding transcriptional LysR family regulator